MKRIGFYRNNNYTVSLFNEGTKIRREQKMKNLNQFFQKVWMLKSLINVI